MEKNDQNNDQKGHDHDQKGRDQLEMTFGHYGKKLNVRFPKNDQKGRDQIVAKKKTEQVVRRSQKQVVTFFGRGRDQLLPQKLVVATLVRCNQGVHPFGNARGLIQV